MRACQVRHTAVKEPSTMKHSSLLRGATSAFAVVLLAALSACSKQEPAAQAPPAAETAPAAEGPLAAAVNSESRSAEDKSRDQYRHPQEARGFWGLRPGRTSRAGRPGPGGGTE